MDLEAGRLDAVVMDETSGKYYNAKKSTLTYSVETLADEDFGVALRKQDKALVDEINRLLEILPNDNITPNGNENTIVTMYNFTVNPNPCNINKMLSCIFYLLLIFIFLTI